MSHIVTIQAEIRDAVAILAACRRLGLSAPEHETVQLYSSRATGWAIRLPGWRYPVVCETETGQLRFDNFGGRWGDQQELDRFRQAYVVEKAKLEVRRQGHAVSEQALADGSIRLTVNLGSAL